MPVPNELTPEDEAQFLEHGMAPLGEGTDPVGGEQEEIAQPVNENEPAPEPAATPARGPDGKFLPKEAAPEPVTDPNAAPVDAPPPGYVPHAALHQERAERARVAQQLATLTQRTNLLLQQRTQQERESVPDMTEDPVAYLTWLQGRMDAFDTARQEEAQYRQIDGGVQQDEEAFKLAVPDYEQASEHYVQSRGRELLAFYPPEEVPGLMLQEVRQMAQQAWQRGQSVGQVIYQMAQARGYQSGQPAPQGAPQPVGTAPAAPTPAPRPTGPAAIVAAAQRGVAASRTLSTGGAAPANQLNAEALASMSDEEFEAMLKPGSKGANERFMQMLG
jgi:hypothetical protein